MKAEMLKDLREVLELNEMNIMELSVDLVRFGCEDIAEFGNMSEILDTGNMVVTTDECGEEHIIIEFDTVWIADGNEESIFASIIRITDVREF